MSNKTADHIKSVLAALPAQVKIDVQPAVDAGATEMMMRMRFLAPKDDGDLQKSIKVEDGPRELSARVVAGGELTTRPVRNSEKGNAPTFDYALAQEYGTAEMPAQPFYWVSVNTLSKRVRRRIDRAISKSIKTAWGK